MLGITTPVGPVDFAMFSGEQFERLVYAYFWRTNRFESLDWLGQLGSDAGRDIWGTQQPDRGGIETWCIQCVNRKRFTFKKASEDMENACSADTGKPDHFRFVIRSSVSASLWDKIRKRAAELELWDTQILTGVAFEERLRRDCESLLRRFCNGEVFPDDPISLHGFVIETSPANDQEWLAIMSRIFDRPAFTTPFDGESSLPDFKQAITDTIEVLNTGKYYNRRGELIRPILPRHGMTDPLIKQGLDEIVRRLVRLRGHYDRLVRSGEIQEATYSEEYPSVAHAISREAAQIMNEERQSILDMFRRLWPAFEVNVGW